MIVRATATGWSLLQSSLLYVDFVLIAGHFDISKPDDRDTKWQRDNKYHQEKKMIGMVDEVNMRYRVSRCFSYLTSTLSTEWL